MSSFPAIALALAGMAAVVAFEAYRMIRQMARRQAALESVVAILCRVAIQRVEESQDEAEIEVRKRVN